MSEQLPSGNFKWIENKVHEAFIMSYQSENNKKGYFIRVDLEYPHHLHDAHNDGVFCVAWYCIALYCMQTHQKKSTYSAVGVYILQGTVVFSLLVALLHFNFVSLNISILF